jgi:hypothetical protein
MPNKRIQPTRQPNQGNDLPQTPLYENPERTLTASCRKHRPNRRQRKLRMDTPTPNGITLVQRINSLEAALEQARAELAHERRRRYRAERVVGEFRRRAQRQDHAVGLMGREFLPLSPVISFD